MKILPLIFLAFIILSPVIHAEENVTSESDSEQGFIDPIAENPENYFFVGLFALAVYILIKSK